ncbi:MAG: hypothetical protein AAF902_16155, partial [Chloroflexota bacterium]
MNKLSRLFFSIIFVSFLGLLFLGSNLNRVELAVAKSTYQGGTIPETRPVTPTIFMPVLFRDLDFNQAPDSLIGSATFDVPDGRALSCEHSWNIRLTTHSFSRRVHTQDLDFSACNTNTDSPTMFAAMTLAHPDPEDPDEYFDNQSGMLVETTLNSLTNQLEVVRQREFPECEEMIGVQASDSCGVVAALCRTNDGRSDFDKDIVATHPNPNNWLQDVEEGRDEMWLYEWTNGDIQSTPSKYIVHKGIGGWEYGQFSLVYGENDNTYGVALKSTRNGHEADSFTVIDRDTYSIVSGRGWDWSCGTGHTIHNRPNYNPFTQEYGM